MNLFLRSIHGALCFLLLTGCWNAKEIEHLLYVNSIGIDYEDGKYIMYVQFIDFTSIAKQETQQRNEQVLVVARGEGKTIDEAAFNLYPTANQRIYWSHAQSIVFTRRALQKDVMHSTIDLMGRYFEFRNTLWMFSTGVPLEELFFVDPIFNVSVLYSQLNDPNDIYSQSSWFKPIRFLKFKANWYEPEGTILLQDLNIDTEHWKQNRKQEAQFVVDGVTIIQNKEPKGFFLKSKMAGSRWLEPGTSRSLLVVEKEKKQIASIVIENPKPKIKPVSKSTGLSFDIEVGVQGVILERKSNDSIEELGRLAEKEIEKQIKETFTYAIKRGTDPYKLAYNLYWDHHDLWKKWAENGRMKLTPDHLGEVKVEVNMISTGRSKLDRVYIEP